MRILIVEADAGTRTFLTRGLHAEGFFIDGARNGRDGIARALARDYDLAILDMSLPDVQRPGALRVLHHRIPALPVLVLCESTDLDTKLKAFELGAVDYLPKPFAFAELVARVRVQLSRPRRFAAMLADNVLQVGDLTLNLSGHQVSIGGVMADLSDREFRLLHFLLLHLGQTISRERLLNEVWGYDFAPGSNVVDVCIRRLRLRLGPRAPIETVRNVGYRLVA